MIKENQVGYINLDAFKQVGTTGKGKHTISDMVESALAEQNEQVAKAKNHSANKMADKLGTPAHELCAHSIYDTFGKNDSKVQEHRCLICNLKWVE